MGLKESIRELIDNLRMSIPGGREFLDKSKDLSVYDIDDPNLPTVDKTITTERVQKMVAKEVKKRTKK